MVVDCGVFYYLYTQVNTLKADFYFALFISKENTYSFYYLENNEILLFVLD